MLKGKINKMEPKPDTCIFVGYPKETTEYFSIVHRIKKVFVSTNATLLKDKKNANQRVERKS